MRGFVFAAATFVFASPAFADEVREALNAYSSYQNDVSDLLATEIDSNAAVDAALARLARHNSDRVARGWIAYGALAAAEAPAFADGVRRRVRTDGRAPVLAQLRSNTTYARHQADGASSAVRIILTSAGADGARAEFAGSLYERFARSGPSTQLVSGGATQIADARERMHVTEVSSRGPGARDVLSGGGREHGDYASVTDNMLTLGALIVTDATEQESERVSALLSEPLTQACMDMQRLQLRQCLSVSVDASERAYCLGRHALTGPGQCFSNVVR